MKSHVHFLPGDMKDEQKGNPTHQHVGTVRHAYTIFIHRKMGSQAGPFLSSNINNWETYSICHIHTKKKIRFHWNNKYRKYKFWMQDKEPTENL